MEIPKGSHLTLIGVVHRDPMGEGRVLPLLDQITCDFLSLEVSEYALSWRLKNGTRLLGKLAGIVRGIEKQNGNVGDSLLSHGQIRGLMETLTIPFEVRAAMRYQQMSGANYHLLDDSKVSRSLLEPIESEMITDQNIARLCLSEDFHYQESIERLYREGQRLLSEEPVPAYRFGLSDENLEINMARDKKMARRLRDLMGDLPGHWVHVCGFTHLIRSEGFKNMAAWFPKAKRILASSLNNQKKITST